MTSLLSMNVVGEGKLLNPTGYPILYYYNGDADNIRSTLFSDKNVISLLKTCIRKISTYGSATLCISYFTENPETLEETNYKEDYLLQEYFTLDALQDTDFCLEFLRAEMLNLATIVFQKKYEEDNIELLDNHALLEALYHQCSALEKKIIPMTFCKYFHSKIYGADGIGLKYFLTRENADFIYSTLENLVNKIDSKVFMNDNSEEKENEQKEESSEIDS